MDEPDLPPLSQFTRATAPTRAPPPLTPVLARKRTRSDHDDEPAASSDPALFSSDETAPGAENYVSGKRNKRTYKGSWWDRHPADATDKGSHREKRQFKRNLDSGVFMGSESEDPPSSDSITMEDEFLRDQQRVMDNQQKAWDNYQKATDENQQVQPATSWPDRGDGSKLRANLASVITARVPREHEEVCAVIRQCLERGKEDVDLTSMSLSSLPAEITSLQTLSKQDEITPGMLHIGTNLEPHLRLFLGNNCFTRMPSPIFELRNLRELSLRNNNLTSIPAAIGELVNLVSLNIAGNQLSELPTEILDLITEGRLRELRLHPNPWMQPDGMGLEESFSWTRILGKILLRKKNSAHTMKKTYWPTENPQVPTLTELALRQLSKFDPLGDIDLGAYMPSNTPESVLNNLKLLGQNPTRRCNACNRPIVLAREEWFEFWSIDEVSESDVVHVEYGAGIAAEDPR
ncbi:uncharacterized protein Z519_10722 [Cladophialophora bantiana CBS 173.52]|uniref:Leucine Rich Repeat domain protein n=1 Tax=Cladophialophora bantiana (strain ATCC 10958 / CBS 173.52 / CDC B-1940 / NIH 8579) TaxID=1442370 RepID=A0A0D2EF16_CLAB1|nr:uncharacterized protein Z519_10722 [Cladophialophora bantiana CBS 173.52]KIW88676.1 hypothetical protein Z519_10722 [Cladophialophora bantiana CBS 173.52]